MTERELAAKLSAAQEVIAVLQRRLARELELRDVDSTAAHRAISSLENTVDLRSRELEASEAHFRALFDHSPSPTFLIDELGIILRANSAATSRFGAGASLVERPLVELFVGDARAHIEPLLDELDGQADEVDLGDGTAVDVSVGRVPGFDHAQVTLRDVSARVALARELQHTRRLAAIGRLAAGVAHEINNPLAVLRLELDQLAAGGELVERLRPSLEHVERIARIVANLRSFAVPQAPRRACVSVRALVDAASTLAGRQLAGVHVEVRVRPPGLAVEVDRGQLEQVLSNLLSNCGLALEGQGRVEVEAFEVVDEVGPGHVCLRISDSGPGIPEAELERIFEPFFRAGEHQGMGLGLAISWGLVQENRGRIRALNLATGGACFELELPRARVEAAAAKPTQAVSEQVEAPALRKGARVLCVEDEAGLRRSLMRLLQSSGHEPLGAASAEEAIELLREHDFDLVLSDVRLPGHDGRWLREHIFGHYPGLAERVVLMSGFFPEGEAPRHFLQKPFSLAQLRGTIAAVLGLTTGS
ncbi:response regulator [Pseudenhygromyxa sp. WMMC2535]|uniref:hybrid sensor histidine kinase/response regulator n=1 Tax=Pseudenhygromyxa sp. WMMC2535 TaxID=2712867 RepID=UPI0015522D85|nr:ATP-binding protein [Pseudenhygromyxa sp. WMMC2535]NVB40258.1 response regulator [Pseudenhygromyxa sp. WMMC2535]